jgi:integrase
VAIVLQEEPDILKQADIEDLLGYSWETRYPERNQMILLLTADAGLSVAEIASLLRLHVYKDGLVGDDIRVPGRRARTVPMTTRLRDAMIENMKRVPGDLTTPIVAPERDQDRLNHRPMEASSVAYVLYKLYRRAGITASSSTGRHTFIKEVLDHAPLVGASTTDVSELVGLKKTKRLKRFGDPPGYRRRSGQKAESREDSMKRRRALVETAAKRG